MQTILDSTQTRCLGICIRRGRVVLIRNDKGMELPSVHQGDLWRGFSDILGVEISDLGPKETHRHPETDELFEWCFLTLLAPPEVNYDARVSENGVCWVPLSEWSLPKWNVTGVSRQFLSDFLSDPGNAYTMVRTVSGQPTFAHLATGEILHSQAGPFVEAENLYVTPLGIRQRQGSYTLYDCGLGCGTLVLAFLQAFLENPDLDHLRIVSFDLEKEGLRALLTHLDHFPEARPFEQFVVKMLAEDLFDLEIPWQEESFTQRSGRASKSVSFQFLKGDFKETLASFDPSPEWLADGVCYDFFSPFSHVDLWDFELLSKLRQKCAPGSVLSTYSSATAVRASFLAAGFFVGEGVPSGKKNSTTLACTQFEHLVNPLTERFVQTFSRSQKPYFPGAAEEQKLEVKRRVVGHPQFAKENTKTLISIPPCIK